MSNVLAHLVTVYFGWGKQMLSLVQICHLEQEFMGAILKGICGRTEESLHRVAHLINQHVISLCLEEFAHISGMDKNLTPPSLQITLHYREKSYKANIWREEGKTQIN